MLACFKEGTVAADHCRKFHNVAGR